MSILTHDDHTVDAPGTAAIGTGPGLCRCGRCRRGPAAGRSLAAAMAGRGHARRDGLHGTPRHETQAVPTNSGPAPCGSSACAWTTGRRMPPTPTQCWQTRHWATCPRYALGRDYHKVMRQALARVAAAIAARIPHDYRVFVDSGAGAGKGAGPKCGSGLDRQTHQPHRQRCGIVLFSGRDTDRPALAHRCTGQCALWQLLGLHSGLPYAGHRGATQTRCAALHFLSDHRAAWPDSRGAACRHRQSHLWLRRLPAGVPMEQVCAYRKPAGFQDTAWSRRTRD